MYKVIYKRIAKIVFETRDVVGNLRRHIRFNCYHGLILFPPPQRQTEKSGLAK